MSPSMLNGASLAIVRTSSTELVALSCVCPHQGGRIDPVIGVLSIG